jgi:hypothetical protein
MVPESTSAVVVGHERKHPAPLPLYVPGGRSQSSVLLSAPVFAVKLNGCSFPAQFSAEIGSVLAARRFARQLNRDMNVHVSAVLGLLAQATAQAAGC